VSLVLAPGEARIIEVDPLCQQVTLEVSAGDDCQLENDTASFWTPCTYLPLPNMCHPRTGLKPRTDGLVWERACRGGGHGGKQAAEQEFEAAA
jgi:hypothetical protein